MMIDLDNVYGKPKYINNTPIHPVKMESIVELYEASTCLLIPKNSMSDLKIIKMSYLSFLIALSQNPDAKHLSDKLITLIKLTTRGNDIQFYLDEKNKIFISIDDTYTIRERDFDKFREIIAIQNLIDTKDNSLGSDFDKAKADAKAYLSKRNGRMADLEQQIIAYRCVQKLPYDEIKNLTIYQFRKELERIDLIKSADVLQNAQYSGMVSFKEGTVIPHWLDHIKDKNPDDDIVLTGEQLKQINKNNGIVSK
ncbi:hypothetical protein ACQKNX_08205 [Lysinibacillus sp. NPDC093712]|uniref:hypothetical protein n=1 Tax=Lysinibacillus sp. NPDC093712 TaxID=3390579 RepID=UPI003D018983